MKYLVTSLFLLFSASSLSAHSWYGSECCSGKDCFKVEADEVYQDKNEKWHYKGYVFYEAKPSKDADFHVCIQYQQHPGSARPLCIYVVQGF